MDLKNLWSKIIKWLRSQNLTNIDEFEPTLDEQGLIAGDRLGKQEVKGESAAEYQTVMVKKSDGNDKAHTIEKLQLSFNILIEQLQGINSHLNQQATHQQELMSRMNKLPELLEKFPAVVENQKQLTEKLFEELKASTLKGQQFVETVGKIPTEIGKQTDTLLNMNHQLIAVADTETQVAENFNKFNQALGKLNQTSQVQTESIEQMGKTFAASDRHLKYLMTIQNKRFMWIFSVAVGVCVVVILVLTGIILYLRR